MLLTSTAPHLLAMADSRISPFANEEPVSQPSEESAARSFSFSQAPSTGLGTAAQEAAFARLSEVSRSSRAIKSSRGAFADQPALSTPCSHKRLLHE